MANLPMPMNPLEAFSKGFHMTDNLMNQILNRKKLAQQNEQFKEKQKQLEAHFQAQFGLSKAAAGRAAQAAMDAHMIAQQKLHPMDALNQKLQALQDWENQQNGGIPGAGSQVKQPVKEEYPDLAKMFSGQNMLAGEEQNPNQAIQVPEESIQEPNAPAGQGLGVFSPEQLGNMLLQRQQQQPTSPVGKKLLPGGIDPDELRKALTYQAYGVKAPSARSSAYQGSAREGVDLARVIKDFGANSPEAIAAQEAHDAKINQQKDLRDLRARTKAGLKPGEKEFFDKQSGVPLGKEIPLSVKERESEEGNILFNELYPLVYKGASPFSGEGSITRLENAARNYKSDPKARKLFDDFLLADKMMAATAVNEASTLKSGHTNQTYNMLKESLEAQDIPKVLKKFIKEYQIPASAQLHAAMRYQKALSDARKKARHGTPATQRLYYNPEMQAQHEHQVNNSGNDDFSKMTNEELAAMAGGG